MSITRRIIFISLIGILLAIPTFSFAADQHGEANSISAHPSAATLQAGSNVTLTVLAYDDQDRSWDVSEFAQLQSDEASGLQFSGSTITASKTGEWNVITTVGKFSTSTALKVIPGAATGLKIIPSSLSPASNTPITLDVVAFDAYGNEWDVTASAKLTTTEPKATISKNSYTPVRAGTWKIYASIGTLDQSISLQVRSGSPEFIAFVGNEAYYQLTTGETSPIRAQVTDKQGNAIANANITYTSKNPSIATVSSEGTLTAKAVGTTSITATAGELKTEIPVTIKANSTTNSNKNTNVNGSILGETDENTNSDTNANTNTAPIENTTDEKTCTEVPFWGTLIIYAGFILILLAYYYLVRKEKDPTWWIFPVLLTAITIIIWARYFCRDITAWWPWVLVAIAILTTWIGRSVLFTHSNNTTTPPENSQPPVPPPSF